MNGMSTDAKALLDAGMAISDALWTDARAEFDWADMDRYVAHQVSQVHTATMCRTIGIDSDRVPRSFPLRGNMGPASIPFTLATQVDSLQTGDRVLLMGVGLGPQRVLHRAGVVTLPPRGLPGLDPGLVAAGHRRPRALVARARPRACGARHAGVRPRQPDVVVPVAAVRRGAPPGWRVVAVDQLGMGSRSGARRERSRTVSTTWTPCSRRSTSPGRS
jgi:hypothetical protein